MTPALTIEHGLEPALHNRNSPSAHTQAKSPPYLGAGLTRILPSTHAVEPRAVVPEDFLEGAIAQTGGLHELLHCVGVVRVDVRIIRGDDDVVVSQPPDRRR